MNIEPKAGLATKLHNSLERIVSYYDKRDFRFPTMDEQAKARHENTMFGEARKMIEEYKQIRERQMQRYAASLPDSGSEPSTLTEAGEQRN